MPNIRQYDTPSLDIRPTETGIEATAGAARRVGSAFNEAGNAQASIGQHLGSAIKVAGEVAVKYEDHREISAGAANFAAVQEGLTQKWNETIKTADPNDPSVAGKFREEVLEPTLQKFREGFNTENSQAWAERHVDALRQHLWTKTSADMSRAAGEAVKINAIQTVNRLSSTVRQDPSSLDFTLKTADSTIGAMVDSSPNIGADAASHRATLTQHAKEQIVKSWFMGVAEKNPDQAVKVLESGKYADYIKGDEAKTIIGYARTNARLIKSEANSARLMQDHVNKSDFNKAVNELELSTVPDEVGDRPTLPRDYWQKIRQIGQMPGAAQEPGRLRTMINNGETITARLEKPEPLGPVSHATTMDLLKRMRATDATRLDSTDDIYKAYGDGKLNTADFNFLNKEFSSLKTPQGELLGKDRGEFFKQFVGLISPGYDPAAGSPKLYMAEMDARRQEEVLRKAGKDPHLVYDPRSEYFFGKPENIAKYQVSLDQMMKERAPSKNLTGPDRAVINVDVKEAPKLSSDQVRSGYSEPKFEGNIWVTRDKNGKRFQVSPSGNSSLGMQ